MNRKTPKIQWFELIDESLSLNHGSVQVELAPHELDRAKGEFGATVTIKFTPVWEYEPAQRGGETDPSWEEYWYLIDYKDVAVEYEYEDCHSTCESIKISDDTLWEVIAEAERSSKYSPTRSEMYGENW